MFYKATLSGVNWPVYGKIQSITNNNTSTAGTITYSYDVAGHRVSKANTYGNLTTWYVRDAQGNTLATYDNAGGGLNWKEQDLYGSSRLGLWTPNLNLGSTTTTANEQWKYLVNKQYELSNHLGNVLATITDRRTEAITGGNVFDHYEADVSTAQDYYAFGSLMPGRQSGSYKYGFNGKENDNDATRSQIERFGSDLMKTYGF